MSSSVGRSSRCRRFPYARSSSASLSFCASGAYRPRVNSGQTDSMPRVFASTVHCIVPRFSLHFDAVADVDGVRVHDRLAPSAFRSREGDGVAAGEDGERETALRVAAVERRRSPFAGYAARGSAAADVAARQGDGGAAWMRARASSMRKRVTRLRLRRSRRDAMRRGRERRGRSGGARGGAARDDSCGRGTRRWRIRRTSFSTCRQISLLARITISAAAEGVGARRSATRSQIVKSVS